EVECRSADRLQYLRDRCLPLERLLCLVEEAHVLDRDRGLASERLDELDLTIGKSAPHPPGQTEDAKKAALGEDRHTQPSPGAVLRERQIARRVGNVGRSPRGGGHPNDGL